MQTGYYRFPSIWRDLIVFTSEDDLWSVPAEGGVARRLTASASEASHPRISPDGRLIAFASKDEGHAELYVMPASGGEARRLTFLGATTRPVGWSRDGSRILFVTNHGAPVRHTLNVLSISPDGGPVEPVPVGPAHTISQSPERGTVIGRHTSDISRWKRYRGGTAGDIWVDPTDGGTFGKLVELRGNLASPMWIGSRIYFLSDHEGYGNIYSTLPDGDDLRRHTDHEDYYARNPQTDGRRIVYHAGGDLYLFDPASDTYDRIPVDLGSPRSQRSRKFIDGARYLQSYAPHPEGHSLALVMRGRPITLGAFAGPPLQFGAPDGVRYRHARYLRDGRRLVVMCDEGDANQLAVLAPDGTEDRLEGLDIGRTAELQVSPTADIVALANHRNEIIVVDLESRQLQVLDRSRTLHDASIAWSPDGKWLAFNHAETVETSWLVIAEVATGELHRVTDPLLHDVAPSFDPAGKYLYFISHREFDPVIDNLHFDLGFPRGTRPYLIPLRRELTSPFRPTPKAPGKGEEKKETSAAKDGKESSDAPPDVKIDFEGITRRLVPFPVKEGRYARAIGADGCVYLLSNPVQGMLDQPGMQDEPQPDGLLECYDLETLKCETIAADVSDLRVTADGRTIVYRSGKRLRVLQAGAKPEADAGDAPGIESGWVDLTRPKISLLPALEWLQMYREAWTLHRDFFWTEGMLGLDWDAIYERYLPLLDRIGSRAELSDVIVELNGELGTSHAYEMGGDYRKAPVYAQGFLGADITFDDAAGVWRIARIVRGDAWSSSSGSPLEAPGVNVAEGDRIVAINGRRLSRTHGPQEQLVNAAGAEVALTVAPADGGEERTVSITTLASEFPARYREWVEHNRRIVHEATGGRVGYLHIPDMGADGYSEFHRGFLAEVGRGSLIVDVRFNGGGFVSELILEKLGRKGIGYGLPRYGLPTSYPMYALPGPIVALTNEYAGSDGDIFSHGFKLMRLGPLIGRRTWGGVVGIWPRNPLVDGSLTTQPEFSTWFQDVKWGLENYGTDPDIEVEITPQDHVAGRDPQLERGIAEALRLLEVRPVMMPQFDERPLLASPPLPSRGNRG